MDFSRDEIEGLMNLFNSKPRKRYADSDDELLDEENQEDSSEIPDNSEESKDVKKPYDKLDPEEEKKCNFQEIALENEALFDEEKPSTDWKKTPKWTLSYRQQVTASDVFLQIGPKNPSTACCEDMILTVWLPNDKRQNIDLKITENRLKLFTPNHFLDAPLPHPVDPQRGNAQWDNDQEKLTIILKMNREFDYVNF